MGVEMRFSNKVVLITGGNSGIGLAAALRFKNEGAKVIVCGRNLKTLSTVANENNLLAIKCDVSNLEELDQLYKQIANTHGKIDVLFANAGIYKSTPLKETSEVFYDEIMSTNVKGLFFTIQKSLDFLNDGASIILTSSVLNQKAWEGNAIYSASKAAVRSFARTLAVDLLPKKIRVNAISPGPTFTPIFDRLGLPEDKLNEIANQILSSIPLNRFGTPEDIANAVLFLGSDDSGFMTGGEIVIDGGLGQI